MLSDLINVCFLLKLGPGRNRVERKSSSIAVRFDSEYSGLRHYICVSGNPMEFSCVTQ